MTQVCSRCVMDAQVPGIRFNEAGICNYCDEFLALLAPAGAIEPLGRVAALQSFLERVKRDVKGSPYDCVIGLSGGVDSSWVLYQAKRLGLRPLAVHMDNPASPRARGSPSTFVAARSPSPGRRDIAVLPGRQFVDEQASPPGALPQLARIGLAADRHTDLVRVLERFDDEMRTCLGLPGAGSLPALDPSYLHRARPLVLPHAVSAFPPLEEGW